MIIKMNGLVFTGYWKAEDRILASNKPVNPGTIIALGCRDRRIKLKVHTCVKECGSFFIGFKMVARERLIGKLWQDAGLPYESQDRPNPHYHGYRREHQNTFRI